MSSHTIAAIISLSLISVGVCAEGGTQFNVSSAVQCSALHYDNWTSQERFVWDKLCNGKAANLREFGEQVLPAMFVRTIILNPTLRNALPPSGVHIDEAHFTEIIEIQNATLELPLWFYNCSFDQGADFSYVKSTQPIGLLKSYIGGPLVLYGITLSSDLNLIEVSASKVILTGARIAHTVNFDKSIVANQKPDDDDPIDLDLRSINVGVDLIMTGGIFKDVDLEYAEIGRLHLSDSHFIGAINMTGASIKGALDFGDPVPHWGDTDLILRNVKADTIPIVTKGWPTNKHISGLTYRALFPAEVDVTNTNVIRDWLKNSERAAQTYEQLAGVLQAQGNMELATEVRIEGKNQERDRSPWQDKVWLWVSYLTVVYGYKPIASICPIAFFICFGWFALKVTGDCKRHEIPLGLAYSFDMLIPLIRLREKHYDIELSRCGRQYFYMHKIVGWILASFLIAGLAGITK